MSNVLDEGIETQNTEEPQNTEESQVVETQPVEADSTALDVEALKKALKEELAESIRKEEKDKLYKSFEKYKEDAKLAEEAKKAAEAKLKEYETSKLTAEEQAALRLKQLEEANSNLQAQMQQLVEEANGKVTALQLELMKKEVLANYGDEIIPALVQGSTIEEIMESAENAHREYVSIREREIAKVKEGTKPKEKIGTGISPQNTRLNSGVTVADIQNMDAEEFYKNRDKLLEKALRG